MGRKRLVALIGLALVAACSGGGGGGSAAPTTTNSAAATSTTQATTSTTRVEDAVKAAYLDYWSILDRLGGAPDPDDAALNVRAIDPVLTSVRDDLATRRAEGRTTRIPAGAKYAHRVLSIDRAAELAVIHDCFVDDRVQFAADGSVLNDRVSTVSATARLVNTGNDWKVSDVQLQKVADGDVPCAG